MNSLGVKVSVGHQDRRRFVLPRSFFAVVNGHVLKLTACPIDDGALDTSLVVAQLKAGKTSVILDPRAIA